MTNIIQFPTFSDSEDVTRLPQTESETEKAIAVNRMVYVDDVVNQMFSKIATKLYHQGYPVDEEVIFKDFILIGELTRSILYSSVGVEHPLHTIITENRERLQTLIDNGNVQFREDSDEDDYDDSYEDDDDGDDDE